MLPHDLSQPLIYPLFQNYRFFQGPLLISCPTTPALPNWPHLPSCILSCFCILPLFFQLTPIMNPHFHIRLPPSPTSNLQSVSPLFPLLGLFSSGPWNIRSSPVVFPVLTPRRLRESPRTDLWQGETVNKR